MTTSTFQSQYGSSNLPITITLASLASLASRECTVVSNTSDKYLDALVQMKVKTGAAGVATTGFVNVYSYASADGGTTYSDGATGSDAGITLTNPPNVRLLGSINTVATATTYKSTPMSVAAAYNGVLPEKWGIIVQNQSGTTFDTVGGSFSVFYQGIKQEAI